MLAYLKAVGFSDIVDNKDIHKLVNSIILNPTKKYISNYNKDEIRLEYYKAYGARLGIVVRGTLNDKEEFIVHTILPFVNSNKVLNILEADVEKVQDKEIYYVFCEEEQTGSQIDFCLQNVIDYLDVEENKDAGVDGIRLVGLAIEGKIILNVDKDEVEELLEKEEEVWRKKLLEKARDGDEEAQEMLEIEAEEIEGMIEERIYQEDLFSIIEGYFMPYGEHECIYSVLGTILKVEEWTNNDTEEKVYDLHITCIGMEFEVCINEKDITGAPMEGMRFLGLCWMHGEIIFS